MPSSVAIGLLGAVEQAGLQEVLRQRVLGAVALGWRQVGARQQVLVHAHRALVFAAAAKQVAEREVQVGGVGVLLHGLDEGVDRLVLLFVEQQVQALEVGLGRIALLAPPLPQVEARSEPAEGEGERQAPAAATGVKVHRAAGVERRFGPAAQRARRAPARRRVAARARTRRCRHQLGTIAKHAEGAAEREGGEHDEDHRRAPVVAEEPVDGGVLLVVQREREQGEEDGSARAARRSIRIEPPAAILAACPRRPSGAGRGRPRTLTLGSFDRQPLRRRLRASALPGLKWGTSFSGITHLLAGARDCARRAAAGG